MSCTSCVQAVQTALQSIPGVQSVSVNLQTGSVIVTGINFQLQQLITALESTGRDFKLVDHRRILELTVDPLTCESCASSIKKALMELSGIDNVQINIPKQQVLITGTTFSTATILTTLEEQDRIGRVVGNSAAVDSLNNNNDDGLQLNHALVAEFKGKSYGHNTIVGVVRAVQTSSPQYATVELTLGGLQPLTKHYLTLHQFGDLRNGTESVGKITDELAQFNSDEHGRASFVYVGVPVNIMLAIGRGIVISAVTNQKENQILRLAAAVAARSAGVNSNDKRVCTCDGTTIWDANHNVESKILKEDN
jgi:copper chaperone for superoxide dismutase